MHNDTDTASNGGGKQSLTTRLLRFAGDHSIFIVSLLFWVIVWSLAFEVLFTYSFLLSPFLIVLYIALLIGHEKMRLKPVASFAWAYPAACLLVVGALYCATGLGARSSVYRLGMDIETPHGVVSCGSMVEVVDGRNPIRSLRRVHSGKLEVRGEAVYCDLGNDNQVVAILAFDDDQNGTFKLAALPRTARQRGRAIEGADRVEIKDELILVRFADVDDLMSIKRIVPADFQTEFGPGYAFGRFWLEPVDGPYVGAGIETRLPWVVRARDGLYLYAYAYALRQIGVVCGYNPFKRDW
ncbi:hypothetical protein DND132_0428 [Pseudodesulfovibrio mercurii]|uniref:Uncharacterized protein n=1 Tax=Pseudodesulfovibrio mercurii TaxID=641491 RepID=F0JF89_9BACT|nr:hypothetical protein [Pseudodesulfovibrio mercurii]EGB13645.1 hypothetical protein DND132_0428 [Pseudodesulfovibrio mercurii]